MFLITNGLHVLADDVTKSGGTMYLSLYSRIHYNIDLVPVGAV